MQDTAKIRNIGTSRAAQTSGEFSLNSFLRVIRRRKWIIIGALCLFIAAAAIITLRTPKQYQAISSIMIDKQSTDSLNLADEAGSQMGGDSMDYNITLKSQLQILTSDTLGLRVIKKMHLAPHLLGKLYDPKIDPATDDQLRVIMLGAFHSRLKVKPLAGSRIVDVSYMDPNRRLATEIVNTSVQEFISNNFERKYEATQQASQWLGQQIQGLKDQINDSDQTLAKLQHKAGFFSETDRGNIELARLEQLNNELLLAQSDRIAHQAILETARRGNITVADQMDAGLAASTGTQASSGMEAESGGQGSQQADTTSSSNDGAAQAHQGSINSGEGSILQQLEGHKAELQLQIAQAAATYGRGYPHVQELQRELAESDKLIAQQSQQVMQRLQAEYATSQRTENQIRNAFEAQRKQVTALNDIVLQYGFAKRDAEASNTLYTDLDSKLREAGVLAGLRSTNVSVIDPARPPVTPVVPNPKINMALGVFAGMFFGIFTAFTLEHLDRTLRTIDEAEHIVGAKILAVVPNLDNVRNRDHKNEIVQPASISLKVPGSIQAEAFTTLRTAILLSSVDHPPKVIMITSSLPGEGKSVVSINFAITLAKRGARVLLAETDLRRPSLERYLDLPNNGGLASALLGADTNTLVQPISEELPGLSVLTAGQATLNAPELLASMRMRELMDEWREKYDYVVLDTPPLLAVSDAAIVAHLADASLLVVRFSKTTRQALSRAATTFSNNHARFLGVVVNDIAQGREEYHEYYGYSSYDNYYVKTDADA